LVLKGNQGGLLERALEVFTLEERRLPGETEAVWNLVRDGEVVRKGTGEVRRTVSYALTGLGPEVADARWLGELLLSRWEVENRSFAALRAFLVSLLRRQGVREKKAALEAFSLNPLAPLRFLGLYAL
jgi:hypothetical protein